MMDIRIVGEFKDTVSFMRENRNLSHFIHPDMNTELTSFEPPYECLHNKPLIIYFVTTTPQHFKNREAIRTTWGREVNPKPIFIMGINDDRDSMVRL